MLISQFSDRRAEFTAGFIRICTGEFNVNEERALDYEEHGDKNIFVAATVALAELLVIREWRAVEGDYDIVVVGIVEIN